MATAFQINAFQNNAFQIVSIPPSPATGLRAPTGKVLILDVVQGYLLGKYPQRNESCQMIVYLGGGFMLGETVQLIFTLPNGSIQYGDPAFAFIGSNPIVQPSLGNFPAGQYLVYTFAAGELFETGLWTVRAYIGAFTSNPVSFQVVPIGVQ